MFNWLTSRRSRADSGGNLANVAVSVPEAKPVGCDDQLPDEPPVVPLDSAFRDLLFGAGEAPIDRPHQTEAEVLRHIDAMLLSPSCAADMVPRLPAILPRVMKSLRSEDASAKDIADAIRRDATLVAEVVRLANSPYYRTRQQITSLEHATFTLGRNGLRQLIANVAFKPVFSDRNGRFSKHARPLIWDHAERCAAAAKCLALDFGDDEFDAYVAGLVHNIGVTVVMRLMDERYARDLGAPAAPFCDDLLGRARRLSSLVVKGWEFPSNVTAAVEAQTIAIDIASMPSLGRALWAADRLSTTRLLVNRGVIEPAENFLAQYFPSNLMQSVERCYATLEAFDQADSD